MAYNPVPSELIHKTLADAGFKEGVAGKEVVFEIANHREPSLVVRVYTSTKVGSAQVAECGKDAIRLVLLHKAADGSTRPVKKGTRVFRTGTTEAILGRMMERARELYKMANYINEVPRCSKCGSPCYYESKKCVRYCWREAAA
jgi:hypothetical protein